MRSVFRSILAGCVVLALSAPAQAAPPGGPAAERKARAALRFEAGKKLVRRTAWAAALAEFLESRRLYPTWSATFNVAVCLQELGRHAEALEAYETLLREFSDTLPKATKDAVRRDVLLLRGRVGAISLDESEPGAVVSIDGVVRGEHPLAAPIRVAAGSHVVRVYKDGFEPFEVRLDIAGGRTARVLARLHAVVQGARLRVAEQAGRKVWVLVDNNLVGEAPWEGPVAAGEHLVALRGEGIVGAQPVTVTVLRDKTASVTLAAEELAASIRVEPVPANAGVAVDSVAVGHGIWESRLRVGKHTVEIAAPGFLPFKQELTLAHSQRAVVAVSLTRDPSSPFWPQRQPRFLLELASGPVVMPGFGGDVSGNCSGACSQRAGFGGQAIVRGGYELGSGLGFGVTAGYLTVAQTISGRRTTAQPVGLAAAEATVDDRLRLRSFLVGAWLGMTIATRFPVHLRLGGGAALGAIAVAREGAVVGRSGAAAGLAPITETHALRQVFVAPEIRVGFPLGRRVEIGVGVEALILLSPSRPRWDATHGFVIPGDGYTTFAAEALVGSAVIALVPGVSARFDL